MMMKKLIVCALLALPISFSYANEAKTQSGHKDHKTSQQGMSHDAQFLDSFSTHHREGIEMAKLAESKAVDPELKRMASKMLKEQTLELEQMKQWRENYSDIQSEVARPQMDMSDLQSASGREFDKKFAEKMVQHHRDGVELAKNMSPTLKNEKIKSFAEKSITKQNEEIRQLRVIAKRTGKQS